MLAANNVKMSGSEKKSEQERVRHFLHKRVTRKFLEFHVEVVQDSGKEMYQKSVLHVQSCFFAN